ncbi:NAD-dependent succinate-semialdehyde dehydrogenase [Aliamphritea hakodatensis]|uniref:NAD-dependent succinate-semialdehyde dehydrogenase n=1 Tax=Aliamphritea hakodatensis TaxID=2895352 RepID=UPI0022FDAB10|nr:NAD-dependent succinate-semialdehyde dehydrogenase [Aliamphritea hakodatensis]
MYDRFGLLINGEWRGSSDQSTRTVVNPATEAIIGSVPMATEKDAEAALISAQQAFEGWRNEDPRVRSEKLRKVSGILCQRAEEIAGILSSETGKPLPESLAEVQAAAEQFEWYADETRRVYGQIIEAGNRQTRMQVIYEPVGVVAAFSAWNFPLLLPARKIAAALAAGCTVIIKPASEAPGSCMALLQACTDAAINRGAINLLTGNSDFLSRILINSPVIRKISLTGSARVGKCLLHLAADRITKVSLELGGHTPAIVFRDANPVLAARQLAASKFRNCGQVCVSPSRFFVHESLYQVFTDEFVRCVNQLRLGNGIDRDVTMGPLISSGALDTALALIEDAVAGGANILAGGRRAAEYPQGFFLQPTVLGNVSDKTRIMSEEPFAPIAPITTFSDYDEVLTRANRLPYGLAAYLFTDQLTTAVRASSDIEAGMVGINDVSLASAEMPFGGIKESGFGREGGSLGIHEYLHAKFIKTRLM